MLLQIIFTQHLKSTAVSSFHCCSVFLCPACMSFVFPLWRPVKCLFLAWWLTVMCLLVLCRELHKYPSLGLICFSSGTFSSVMFSLSRMPVNLEWIIYFLLLLLFLYFGRTFPYIYFLNLLFSLVYCHIVKIQEHLCVFFLHECDIFHDLSET